MTKATCSGIDIEDSLDRGRMRLQAAISAMNRHVRISTWSSEFVRSAT